MKLKPKATPGEEKLNILVYNFGLKTKFHISFLKTILDFAKLCVCPGFLPKPFNFLHGYIRHIRDISQLWWWHWRQHWWWWPSCSCSPPYNRLVAGNWEEKRNEEESEKLVKRHRATHPRVLHCAVLRALGFTFFKETSLYGVKLR